MEINHTPSLTCDTPLDHRIKHALITETWSIINVQPTDKQRHLDRERAQFAKRMQQVKNVHNVNTTLGNAPPVPGGTSGMIPIDQMVNGLVSQQPDQLTAIGIVDEALLSTEQFVDEHRRKEDAKAKNYRRIYPSSNIQLQMLYERILVVAKSISSIPTTAAQEQRQTEIRAEREKREMKGRPLLGGGGSSVPSNGGPQNPLAALGDQSAPNSSRAYHSAPTPPQAPAPRCESANSNRSTPSLDEMFASQPFVRSAMMRQGSSTVTPPSVANSGGSGSQKLPRTAPSSTLNPSSNEKPKRTKEEVEKQRQRLAEQMERHRRRMVLGPRLSVFQLREAQLAAMFDEDGNVTSSRNTEGGSSGQSQSASLVQVPLHPNPMAGVNGATSFASQQEQFQAILDQLSKYHIASEYYPSYSLAPGAGSGAGAHGGNARSREEFDYEDCVGEGGEEEEE